MQNSIIKEFENNPNVVAVIYNEGGTFNESLDWTKTLWDNYYLRGGILWDRTGDNSKDNYDQPDTGLPFGRAFIIDQQGNVARPYFGHNPDLAIETIFGLLENTADLSIAKEATATGDITAGDRVTYTLTITNAGYTTPVTATIVDTWTPATAVVGVDAPGCNTADWVAGVITCTRSLSQEAAYSDVVLATSIVYSGTLTNVANVTTTGGIVDYLDNVRFQVGLRLRC